MWLGVAFASAEDARLKNKQVCIPFLIRQQLHAVLKKTEIRNEVVQLAFRDPGPCPGGSTAVRGRSGSVVI